MNLHALLRERAAAGRPLRASLLGAGKFGSMWLAQVPRTPGVHVVAVADLRPDRAREALAALRDGRTSASSCRDRRAGSGCRSGPHRLI